MDVLSEASLDLPINWEKVRCKMDDKQFKLLMEELTKIRNLLILNASKAGATSPEISKIINTSDSRVRQILTATGAKKKKVVSSTQEVDN